MKNCTFCEKPLEKPIDVYGPEDIPACQTCFLAGKLEQIREEQRLNAEMEEEAAFQKAFIEEIESEVSSLENKLEKQKAELLKLKGE
jgi:uncharacterized coiled-coil protein SlyX